MIDKLPVPSREVIAEQARQAAAAGTPIRDACPYPFASEAGRHFVAVYALALPKPTDGVKTWDASQIKQPSWNHVEVAFIEGAREARANPDADEAMFRRAADGYTKRVFEEVDPTSEAALRTESWRSGSAGTSGVSRTPAETFSLPPTDAPIPTPKESP